MRQGFRSQGNQVTVGQPDRRVLRRMLAGGLVLLLIWLAFAVTAAGQALAVGKFTDYAPPRLTNMAGCPAVSVVGFAGSGAAFDDGGLGLGGSVKPLYSDLARRFGASNVGASAVDYPAIPFVVSPSLWRPDLVGATAKSIAAIVLSSNYSDSVLTGRKNGASDITHLALRCPSTKIVVAGFSQGAHAARLALARLNDQAAGRVAAVVLMGDAGFRATEPGVTVSGGHGAGTGLAWVTGVAIPPLAPRYAGRVLSACHNDDPVCRPLVSSGLGGHGYDGDAAALGGWVAARLTPASVPGGPAASPGRSSTPVAPTRCAEFVADRNVPDGTVVQPGQALSKTWRLRNCGTANWAGTSARRTSGTFGPASFPLPAAAPGAVVDVTVPMTAPTTPGVARSTYALPGSGARVFWAQVSVQAPVDCGRFISDVTVPDGTVVARGQAFSKTWRLRNCGTTNWTGVAAVRVLGNYGPPSFTVPAVAPGAVVDVTVPLSGPGTAGVNRAAYQLRNAAGEAVSDQFWVEVLVPRVATEGRSGRTSYDRMSGGAPYHGYFGVAFQAFTAQSNRLTTLGATVGNPALAPGQPAATTLTVKLCADSGCRTVLGQGTGGILNYGPTVVDIGDVPVTKGATYFVFWSQPASVAGTSWVTYWWSGGSSLASSDQMQALVRGFDVVPPAAVTPPAVIPASTPAAVPSPTASAAPGAEGDLTGDGFVGCADLNLLKAHFPQSPAAASDGDLNADGTVNVLDLSALLSRWNPPAGEPACS